MQPATVVEHLAPPVTNVHAFPSPNLLQKVALSESVVPVGVMVVQSNEVTHLDPS